MLSARILDVLGRPVWSRIPPGQGSVTPAAGDPGHAAARARPRRLDLAELCDPVRAVGALGDDLLGDIVIAAIARLARSTSSTGWCARAGVQSLGHDLAHPAERRAARLPRPGRDPAVRPHRHRPRRHPRQPGPAHRRPGRADRDDRRGPPQIAVAGSAATARFVAVDVLRRAARGTWTGFIHCWPSRHGLVHRRRTQILALHRPHQADRARIKDGASRSVPPRGGPWTCGADGWRTGWAQPPRP